MPMPPNPATAKKIAVLKKQKEEKMKTNKPAPLPPAAAGEDAPKGPAPPKKTAAEIARERLEKAMQNKDSGSEVQKPPEVAPGKWYMGQYGTNEGECQSRHSGFLKYFYSLSFFFY